MSTDVQLVLVGVLGAVLGVGVALLWRLSEKKQREIPPHPAPAIPAGVESVLSVLRSSTVVLNEEDRVEKASAPAFAIGLVHDDRLANDELSELVRKVRRDGEVRQTELTLTRNRAPLPLHLVARVAPLSSKLVLVLVDDRTRERRVEAIRRDFVANVSHELKTPVGAMNLLAEAVAEAKDDPDAVERFAGRIQLEGERLKRLVQQIIELSRLQADELVDEPVEVGITELVDAAIERSRTDAEAKDIALRGRTDGDFYVLGEPEQILAAVSNLVENAVAYSPEGSRVAVVASAKDSRVQITVTDRGIGIPQAEIERIFERFYRVDPARARTTGGTGLGLSIVKHVAASHGGEVRVWSEPGQGSSFTICLPLHENASEPEAESESQTINDADSVAQRTSKETTL
ncbi:ATP-binding protein [Nocardioidaceae bacterium SCSIO 66511]|nr:ATP-binding protein [Nocardioidaceae bacterium SCSIO 66511]